MIKQVFEFGIFLGLPALFVGIAASVAWAQLSRPWLFVFSFILILYVLYVAMFCFAAPTSIVSMDLIVPTNKLQASVSSTSDAQQVGAAWFPLLSAYLRPILLFSVVALPVLWFAVKVSRK